MILLCESFSSILGCRIICGHQCETTAFVDLGQDVADVVVEAALESQHYVNAWRLTEQALLMERVWLQPPFLHRADLELVPKR